MFKGQRPEGLLLKAVKLHITWREAAEMEAPSEKSHHSVGSWKQKSASFLSQRFPSEAVRKNAKSNGAKRSTKESFFVFFRLVFFWFSCCFNSRAGTDL